MRSFTSRLVSFGRAGLLVSGLLFLTACNSSNQSATPESTPAGSPSIAASTPPSETAAKSTAAPKNADHSAARKGGQVVETGTYHLEFVPEKEADASHLDFYLLKTETHESVPNAKVTAQVQLPNGSQKSLNLKYDGNDKHYTGILPGTIIGNYKVAILSDINGEKVNGRFSFNR